MPTTVAKKLTSIQDVDLSPMPGKSYWNTTREFREEFIYFLLVDRFHDGKKRKPRKGSERSIGSGGGSDVFCGGNLRGVTSHLDYIRDLGCTAIWLSPVFHNNPTAYHGYAIQNYLDVDPRFGTKADLVELVKQAHDRDMRVILDVVINHSGDNWYYPGDQPYDYSDQVAPGGFQFGDFRWADYPIPTELRDPEAYHRCGQIKNFDRWPESEFGDFFGLKDFYNEPDERGRRVMDVLLKAHCYWIREADVDGFRVDAVKHMGREAVARFSSGVREYAYSLGKRGFYLFGELQAGDDAIDAYIGPNTSSGTLFYGLNSVLDFPLFWTLPEVLKGGRNPQELIDRYNRLSGHALNRGELGRFLVTFVDNHDQSSRFGFGAQPQQIVAGIGYLLTAMGTACIYYGTEQGLSGHGGRPEDARECLFSLDEPTRDYLNPNCSIYQEIAKIARVQRDQQPLRFGRMYFREISGNGTDFGLPTGQPCTLAFSRLLAEQELLVAYNTSTSDPTRDCVVVDALLHKAGDRMNFLYGGTGSVLVEEAPNGTRYVRLPLDPMQFVILK